MKFATIKKMESEIADFNKREQLDGDITVFSQGEELFLENLGIHKINNISEILYMGTKSANSFRVKFESSDNTIKIIETKFSRA